MMDRPNRERRGVVELTRPTRWLADALAHDEPAAAAVGSAVVLRMLRSWRHLLRGRCTRTTRSTSSSFFGGSSTIVRAVVNVEHEHDGRQLSLVPRLQHEHDWHVQPLRWAGHRADGVARDHSPCADLWAMRCHREAELRPDDPHGAWPYVDVSYDHVEAEHDDREWQHRPLVRPRTTPKS
jgi:hypothetical protein